MRTIFLLALSVMFLTTVRAEVFQLLDDGSYLTTTGVKSKQDIEAEVLKAQQDYSDSVDYCEKRIAEKRAILDTVLLEQEEVRLLEPEVLILEDQPVEVVTSVDNVVYQ